MTASNEIMQKAKTFVASTLADNIEIKRLAGLPALIYEREREAAAVKLGCRVPILDKLIEAERDKCAPNADTKQGRPIEISDVELWPETVDGAAVLNTLVKSLRLYVVVSDVQADALALWTAHTHAHDASDTSPRLVLKSPQKRSGKTRLVEVLARITSRPLSLSGIRPAALLRLIETHRPTLLLDEMDAAMKQDREMAEALRGLINSGFDRANARYVMNVPMPDGGYEPRAFSTWCPQLLSGIGNLPDTVRDRSIEIDMQRKTRDQKVNRLRRRDGGELHDIARKLVRWVADNMAALRESVPKIPTGLNDRAADAWEPLFAIADLAGGDWPERARKAALALSGDTVTDDEEIGSMLLADIAEIFNKDVSTQHISSADLADALASMMDRPWADWRNGKAITQNALARLLRPYQIVPGTIRVGSGPKDTAKGYKLDSFKDAFARYLPPPADSDRHTVTIAAAQALPADSELSHLAPLCRIESSEKTNNDAHCDGVTDAVPPSVHVRKRHLGSPGLLTP